MLVYMPKQTINVWKIFMNTKILWYIMYLDRNNLHENTNFEKMPLYALEWYESTYYTEDDIKAQKNRKTNYFLEVEV